MSIDHECAMGIAQNIWQHVEQDRRERGADIPLADYEILAGAYRDIYAQLEATERYADSIAAFVKENEEAQKEKSWPEIEVMPKHGHCLLDVPVGTPCSMAGHCLKTTSASSGQEGK